jgi:predicted phage baseplate assembly protein
VSTLRVTVDGLDWEDPPMLHTDDDGTTELVFGDGVFGARLPTGTENVTATYRSGGGRDGLVPAASLTLLQTRPPGVRAVTNPLPADGAAAPETLDSARGNAPIAVRTLDRVVSLDDVADFARAFAGVGKAEAVALSDHGNRVAHLTIAGEDGTVIERDSPVAQALAGAIRLACDPATATRVDGHQPLFFDLHARIVVERKHSADAVAGAARAAVLEAFSFQRRDFGQPVSAAEVIAAIQRVPGVLAVDLDRLYPVGLPPTGAKTGVLMTVLAAAHARPGPGGIRPAQLLLANPVGITVAGVGEL